MATAGGRSQKSGGRTWAYEIDQYNGLFLKPAQNTE